MRLYITYQTTNNRFNSFEVECNYRKQALQMTFNKADYKSLHSVVRLKDRAIRYNAHSDINGCYDDHLKRVKY